MKKIKMGCLLLCILMLSGCIKSSITTTITKDKTVIMNYKMLLSDQLLGEESDSFAKISDEDKASFDKKGFSYETAKEDGYSGFSLKKVYKNIDKISNETGKEIQISAYTDDEFDDSILFKVKKGLLKNTYTATFKYDPTDLNDEGMSDLGGDSTIETDSSTNSDSIITDDSSTDNSDLDFSQYGNLLSEYENKYIVNLPNKAKDNNATNVTNDGKTLTWDLASDKATDINYSFELYNYKLLYGGIIAAVLVIAIAVIIVIKSLKNKKEMKNQNSEPIHTDYDPSLTANGNQTAIAQENNAGVVTTPVVETPTVEAPAVETPVVETPAVEEPTLVAEAPQMEAVPVVEAPTVETPAVEEPTLVAEAPQVEVAPVIETPVVETPAVDEPELVAEAPQMEAVSVGEAPVAEAPVVETPVVEVPTVEAPAVETSQVEVPTEPIISIENPEESLKNDVVSSVEETLVEGESATIGAGTPPTEKLEILEI